VSLSEISVDSVSPLYGPVSGGTRVTITGQYLSAVTSVYVGQYQRIPDTKRSLLSNKHDIILKYEFRPTTKTTTEISTEFRDQTFRTPVRLNFYVLLNNAINLHLQVYTCMFLCRPIVYCTGWLKNCTFPFV